MNSAALALSDALFTAILHSIWQGCALAAVFVVLGKYCRSSQARYLLAMSLFISAPLAFAFTFFQAYSPASSVDAQSVHSVLLTPPLAMYIAIAWCGGVIVIGGRFLGAWIWLRVFILRSAVAVPPPLQALFDASKSALNISNRVVVRTSTLIRSPMVTGVFKPVVLIPLSMASGIPQNVIRAVFTHELLHLRRLDHITVLIQAFGETLLFFHPAVRWLSAEARRAREYRCDDDSIVFLGDKYEYARALVTLEQSRTDNTLPALMIDGGDLMDRVKRILVTQTTSKRSRFNVGGLVAFVCAAVMTYSLSSGGQANEDTAHSANEVHSLGISWLPPSVTQWREFIEKAAVQHDVPADLLALVLFTESGGNAQATSSAGARGLMQVMPQTATLIAERRGISTFATDQLFDPETNIDFGAWYLATQMTQFSQHEEMPIALAISAYNAGPARVKSYLAGKQALPEETIRYRDMLLSMLSEKDSSQSATIQNYITNLRQRLPVFGMPVKGKVTSRFGSDFGRTRTHNGVDIAASTGTPVFSPVAGQVAEVGEDAKRGKYITVRHAAGIESHYYHLNDISVASGENVESGTALGEVGNTGVSSGAHLHFEIREFGQPVSPALYGLKAE